MAATLLATFTVVASEPAGISQVGERPRNFEGVVPASHTLEAVINLGVDPVGTFTNLSATFDCAQCFLGFGQDRWDFTVTVPTDVTVEVNDCCIEGDRYEARCNNRALDEDGDGDINNHEEDCIFGREDINVAVGTFANLGTVTLEPGDWTVRIRDVQFQCGTSNPGCPAGYTMRITFGPPSGTPCAGLPSCFEVNNGVGVPDSCKDISLPRVDDPCELIEAKLDGLEPQIAVLEQKLDALDPQIAALESKLDAPDPEIVALEQKLDELQFQIDIILQALVAIEAKLDDPGGGFCSDPVNPCLPCQLGTVCPDGTPCGPVPGCP